MEKSKRLKQLDEFIKNANATRHEGELNAQKERREAWEKLEEEYKVKEYNEKRKKIDQDYWEKSTQNGNNVTLLIEERNLIVGIIKERDDIQKKIFIEMNANKNPTMLEEGVYLQSLAKANLFIKEKYNETID